MSEEDVTKTTRYVKALEDVTDAANKAAEARGIYDNAFDEMQRLGMAKVQAERELRDALDNYRQLIGKPPLPMGEFDRKSAQDKKGLKRPQDGNSEK